MSDIRRLLESLDAISEASPIDDIRPKKQEYKSVLDPNRYSADQARQMGLIGDKEWASRKEQEQAVERLYPEQLIGAGVTKGVGKPSVWTSGRTGQPMTPPTAPKPKIVVRPGETPAQAIQRSQAALQPKVTAPRPDKVGQASAGEPGGLRDMPPPKGYKSWDQYDRMTSAQGQKSAADVGPPNLQVPPKIQGAQKLRSPTALPLGPYDQYGPQPGGGGKQGTGKADGATVTPSPAQTATPSQPAAQTVTTPGTAELWPNVPQPSQKSADIGVEPDKKIDLPRISGTPADHSPFVVAAPTQPASAAPAATPAKEKPEPQAAKSAGTGSGTGGGQGTGTGAGTGSGSGFALPPIDPMGAAEKRIPGYTRESASIKYGNIFKEFIDSYDVSIGKKK